MKKCLWVLLNKTFRKDLELLYGIGSSVDIIDVKKCTTNKHYLINCKLHISDVDLFTEVGPDGINHLLMQSWEYTGVAEDKFVLSVSYDIIQ